MSVYIATSERHKKMLDDAGLKDVYLYSDEWGRRFFEKIAGHEIVIVHSFFDRVNDATFDAAWRALHRKGRLFVVPFGPGEIALSFDGLCKVVEGGDWIRIAQMSPLEEEPPLTLTAHDFYFHSLLDYFIFRLTGAKVTSSDAINTQVPREGGMLASDWIERHHHCVALTWYPGKEHLIRDSVYGATGFAERVGSNTVNLWIPPSVERGDPAKAGPFVELVTRLFPTRCLDADKTEADHILDALAHGVQHPDVKLNHMILFGGDYGIGKDTVIASVVPAFGKENYQTVHPSRLVKEWTGFMQCCLLGINEVHDLGEQTREAFYERLKEITATPPDLFEINKKYTPHYFVPNVATITGTTNYLEGGIYIPHGDRRVFFAWSPLPGQTEGAWRTPEEWQRYYDWLEAGGFEAIAGFLHARDLSRFNPKAPPPMTDAKQRAIAASAHPEDAALSDVLEGFEGEAVTLAMIATRAWGRDTDLARTLFDKTKSRNMAGKLARAGYVICKNPDAKDGLWRVPRDDTRPAHLGGGRTTRKANVYVPKMIDGRPSSLADQVKLVNRLLDKGEPFETANDYSGLVGRATGDYVRPPF